MKTIILLLLAVSLGASEPSDYSLGLSKPHPSKDFVTGFESGVRYGLIAKVFNPEEDDIPVLTNIAKSMYFKLVVDEGKGLLAGVSKDDVPAASSVDAPEVARNANTVYAYNNTFYSGLMSKDDLRDVVKAMEILDAASTRPSIMDALGGAGITMTTDAVYRPYGFSASEKAEMARQEAAKYEAQAQAEKEQYERIQWARAILQKLRAKVEGKK
jgi:hypothetical protein